MWINKKEDEPKNNGKLKVESKNLSFPSSPIWRGVSKADGEGVLESMKVRW